MTSPRLDGITVKMVELNLPSNHFQFFATPLRYIASLPKPLAYSIEYTYIQLYKLNKY